MKSETHLCSSFGVPTCPVRASRTSTRHYAIPEWFAARTSGREYPDALGRTGYFRGVGLFTSSKKVPSQGEIKAVGDLTMSVLVRPPQS